MTRQSIHGELGELIATQFLDEQGVAIFRNWSKSVNANGFDFLAYDPKTGKLWLVDNKAYSGTISEVTSFSSANYTTNLAEARSFLRVNTSAEANAALAALDKGSVEKVVVNAFSKGNAGFSEKVFASGIKAFDVRLGKLYSSRAAWMAELREAGLLSGIRRFSRRDRILGSQRGFATVGGMVFTLIAVGTTVYAISQAEDKLEALEEAAADFAIAGLAYRLAGGVGLVAISLLSLCGDSAQANEECARREIVMKFLRKWFPSAIKTNRYLWIFTTEEVNPDLYQEAYDLLFNTRPITLPKDRQAIEGK